MICYSLHGEVLNSYDLVRIYCLIHVFQYGSVLLIEAAESLQRIPTIFIESDNNISNISSFLSSYDDHISLGDTGIFH